MPGICNHNMLQQTHCQEFWRRFLLKCERRTTQEKLKAWIWPRYLHSFLSKTTCITKLPSKKSFFCHISKQHQKKWKITYFKSNSTFCLRHFRLVPSLVQQSSLSLSLSQYYLDALDPALVTEGWNKVVRVRDNLCSKESGWPLAVSLSAADVARLLSRCQKRDASGPILNHNKHGMVESWSTNSHDSSSSLVDLVPNRRQKSPLPLHSIPAIDQQRIPECSQKQRSAFGTAGSSKSTSDESSK